MFQGWKVTAIRRLEGVYKARAFPVAREERLRAKISSIRSRDNATWLASIIDNAHDMVMHHNVSWNNERGLWWIKQSIMLGYSCCVYDQRASRQTLLLFCWLYSSIRLSSRQLWLGDVKREGGKLLFVRSHHLRFLPTNFVILSLSLSLLAYYCMSHDRGYRSLVI